MRDALRIPAAAYSLLGALAVVMAVALLLPTLIVIPMSFSDAALLEFPPQHWSVRWWQALPRSADWMHAIRLSALLALVTSVVAVPLAALAAHAATRARGWAALVIHRTLTAPLIVPAILIATGLFFAYARLLINGTFFGLLIGHVLIALPAAYMVLKPAFGRFDNVQFLAALSLGANKLQACRSIVLPQLRVSLLSALLLAFLTSLDEVIISVFVGGGKNTTITKLMFESLRDRVDPMMAVVATAWTALVVSVLAVVWVMGQSSLAPAVVAGVDSRGTRPVKRRLKFNKSELGIE